MVRTTSWVRAHTMTKKGSHFQFVSDEMTRHNNTLTSQDIYLSAHQQMFGNSGRQTSQYMVFGINYQTLLKFRKLGAIKISSKT